MLERERGLIGNANAAVRHGLTEEPRFAGSVDADLPPTRPLGQPRIRTRLQREDSEKRIVRDEACCHVELTERSLTAGRPDGNLGVEQPLAAPEQLDPPEAAVHDDVTLRRLERRARGGYPAAPPVRAHPPAGPAPSGPLRAPPPTHPPPDPGPGGGPGMPAPTGWPSPFGPP